MPVVAFAVDFAVVVILFADFVALTAFAVLFAAAAVIVFELVTTFCRSLAECLAPVICVMIALK
jgi:class 3 adenylate cyclase